MGKGDLFIFRIVSGADKEKIGMLPGRERGIAPPIGDKTPQDFTQGAPLKKITREFDNENAPRLARGERPELANHAIGQSARLGIANQQLIGVQSKVISSNATDSRGQFNSSRR